MAVIPAAKIPDVLVGDAKGVVINPLSVNVQLQVAKRKRPEAAAAKPEAEPVKPEADA